MRQAGSKTDARAGINVSLWREDYSKLRKRPAHIEKKGIHLQWQTSHCLPANNPRTMKRTLLTFALLCGVFLSAHSQRVLSLDSCRALALAGNKTLAVSQARSDKALYDHKAARTNYLPSVAVMAGYMRTGDQISLLSDEQKQSLSTLGTQLGAGLNQAAGAILQQFPDLAPLVGAIGSQLPAGLDAVGKRIVDAFDTDTRNMGGAAIVLTQPLYMGGKIKAYDRITKYAGQIAGEQLRADRQNVILETDRAYWQVVSLVNKKKLAEN